MNKYFAIAIIAMIVAMTIGIAFADVSNVTVGNAASIVSIKVNGDTYVDGDTLKVNLGDTLNIRVKVQATQRITNLEASARLVGYEYNTDTSISDTSGLFDLQAGDTEYVDLTVKVPILAEKDVYELRVDLDGRAETFGQNAFTIRVAGPRSGILIQDMIFTPSGSVESGRSILGQARLENLGEKNLDDVKITMSIPALDNIESSVYMNSINGETTLGKGETKSSEEIYLRIPPCAKAGTYDLITTVDFDNGQQTTRTDKLTITDGGLCTQSQTTAPTQQRIIVTAPSAQNVQIGVGGASFPVVIQNTGTASKTFIVSVNGITDWGAYQISDAAPIVAGGETKVVYIYVTAHDGVMPGARTFGIDITADGNKQSIAAQAILTQPESQSSWKGVLVTIAIILLVIVIVLAVIVAMRKMKDDKQDDDEAQEELDEKGQAYY